MPDDLNYGNYVEPFNFCLYKPFPSTPCLAPNTHHHPQEDYAQKVRLGHEDAIRQLEERIQSKLVVASNKRESEILKKLETLREHVS